MLCFGLWVGSMVCLAVAVDTVDDLRARNHRGLGARALTMRGQQSWSARMGRYIGGTEKLIIGA